MKHSVDQIAPPKRRNRARGLVLALFSSGVALLLLMLTHPQPDLFEAIALYRSK